MIPCLILSAALLGVLAASLWLVRQKHRQLFAHFSERTGHLRREIDLLRREIRVLDYYRQSGPQMMYKGRVYFASQNGEDTYIWDFFERRPSGFFIEAGAADGIQFSNTYWLEAVGWKGLLVEAHPQLAEQCGRNRPNSRTVLSALDSQAGGTLQFHCVDHRKAPGLLSFIEADESHLTRCREKGHVIRVVEVPRTSLNELCQTLDQQIDLVSLDLEGRELRVLKGFDLRRHKPRLLVVEATSRDQTSALEEYLRGFDYHVGFRLAENLFFGQSADLDRLRRISNALGC